MLAGLKWGSGKELPKRVVSQLIEIADKNDGRIYGVHPKLWGQ